MLRLTSPIPPSVNHYIGVRAVIKSGKPLALLYETKEAKRYKQEFKSYIAEEVSSQNFIGDLSGTQHYYCDCIFYFDRIDKDPNNYFKCLLDAITETQLIWADDNVVCERVNRIYYDSKNPRIEISIYPVDYIGIFDNAHELKTFMSSCEKCLRIKNNCSVLRKAIEGRVQDEIQCGICSKFKGDKNGTIQGHEFIEKAIDTKSSISG